MRALRSHNQRTSENSITQLNEKRLNYYCEFLL